MINAVLIVDLEQFEGDKTPYYHIAQVCSLWWVIEAGGPWKTDNTIKEIREPDAKGHSKQSQLHKRLKKVDIFSFFFRKFVVIAKKW